MTSQRQPKAWEDLTSDEQALLRRLNSGSTSLMTSVQVDHMLARGLAEKRLGGRGLSPLGRDILMRMVAAAKKRPQS